MEYSLKKFSQLALIFFPLLNENYHSTKILIDKIRNYEKNEALRYHIEKQSLKHTIFEGYSFLYTIKGRYNNNKMIIKKNKKSPFIIIEGNHWGVYNSQNERHLEAIKKYEKMLETPKITQKQIEQIKKMIDVRKSKLVN